MSLSIVHTIIDCVYPLPFTWGNSIVACCLMERFKIKESLATLLPSSGRWNIYVALNNEEFEHSKEELADVTQPE